MSYARAMGTMYATAGLGWGLGFDRPASGAPAGVFVTGVSNIVGPSGWNTAGAPTAFIRAFEARGFHAVTSAWEAGGRLWIRYSVRTEAEAADTAGRRARARGAIEAAARNLGVKVTLDDGTIVGAGSATPAPVSTPEITVTVTREVPTTVVNTRTLQQTLLAKGFNPGTIDGLWGRNTSGALNQAAAAAGTPVVSLLSSSPAVGADDKRSVQLPSAAWAAIQALPARAAPSTPAPPAEAPTATIASPTEVPEWLPWAIGAGVLTAVGGYFVWRGRRRGGALAAVTANRRSRRRR